MRTEAQTPEFSRRVRAADLEDGRETAVSLAADAAERAALARRFGLTDLVRLQAAVRLLRTGPLVTATADLEADVVQSCVVTLEPVPAAIRDRATRLYADPGPADEGEGGEEVVVQIDEDDPPEPIVDGAIDIGELVAEEMGLRLEPYPRSPGAAFDAPAGEDALESPFVVLGRLKDGRR